MKTNTISLLIIAFMTLTTFAQEDKHLWLEEVENPKALEWVEKWNEKSLTVLKSQKNYQTIYDKNLEIYNSNERIADPSIRGEFIFNFWQDQNNPRGIWRRTSVKSYISGNPEWETLIDIDKLAEKDDINGYLKVLPDFIPTTKNFL
jgi:prolyl oligopeptidase